MYFKGKFPRDRNFILHSLPPQLNVVAAGFPFLVIDSQPRSGEPWQLLETASGNILGKEHSSDVYGHLFYNGMGVRGACDVQECSCLQTGAGRAAAGSDSHRDGERCSRTVFPLILVPPELN